MSYPENLSDQPNALLEVAKRWWTPDPRIVGKLPRGGNGQPTTCRVCGGYHRPGAIHLDFVGHADLTRALIEIDPLWKWEPFAKDEFELPRIIVRGKNYVLWAHLTLLGKTLPCVGTCATDKDDADKELIGDMLRNGAQRFGIFGALWSKTDGWQDDDATTNAPTNEGVVGSTVESAASVPLPPVSISQPDKPLAAMTMRELLDFATENAITVSGTKTDIVRILEPLVRAASGEEPWEPNSAPTDEGAVKPAGVKETVAEVPFQPTVFTGAAEDSGTARAARNSANRSDS